MTWPCDKCEPQMDAQFAYARGLIVENARLREELRIARFDADVPIRELREENERLKAEVVRLGRTT